MSRPIYPSGLRPETVAIGKRCACFFYKRTGARLHARVSLWGPAIGQQLVCCNCFRRVICRKLIHALSITDNDICYRHLKGCSGWCTLIFFRVSNIVFVYVHFLPVPIEIRGAISVRMGRACQMNKIFRYTARQLALIRPQLALRNVGSGMFPACFNFSQRFYFASIPPDSH